MHILVELLVVFFFLVCRIFFVDICVWPYKTKKCLLKFALPVSKTRSCHMPEFVDLHDSPNDVDPALPLYEQNVCMQAEACGISSSGCSPFNSEDNSSSTEMLNDMPLDLSMDSGKHELQKILPKGGCAQCSRAGRLTKRGRPHESYFGCRSCHVHLCRKRACFDDWHTFR